MKLTTPRVHPASIQTSSTGTGDTSVCPSILLVSACVASLAPPSPPPRLPPSFLYLPCRSKAQFLPMGLAQLLGSLWHFLVLYQLSSFPPPWGNKPLGGFVTCLRDTTGKGRSWHLNPDLLMQGLSADPIQTAYVRVVKTCHPGTC